MDLEREQHAGVVLAPGFPGGNRHQSVFRWETTSSTSRVCSREGLERPGCVGEQKLERPPAIDSRCDFMPKLTPQQVEEVARTEADLCLRRSIHQT